MFAINSGKSVANFLPNRYDLERRFKMVESLSSKIEAQCRQMKSLREFFAEDIVGKQQQLCEEVKILFRYAPIEYGKECEEYLWKRNYYEYTKFFKRNHGKLSDAELLLFRMHITSGIGYYHSLILSFRKIFNLSFLDDFINLSIVSSRLPIPAQRDLLSKWPLTTQNQEDASETFFFDDIDEDDIDLNETFDLEYVQDEKFKETVMFLVHRFFICIGDLARYYVDYFSKSFHHNNLEPGEHRFAHPYFHVSSFYYRLASAIKPLSGMPFNQLGFLHTGSFWGLDTLFYYFKCLNSREPFLGVKGNMKVVFNTAHKRMVAYEEKNKKIRKNSKTNGYNPLISLTDDIDFPTDTDLVQYAILKFINFVSALFFLLDDMLEPSKPVNVPQLYLEANHALVFFCKAINIDVKFSSRSKPNRLTTESVSQVVAIVIILVDQIKTVFKTNQVKINLAQIKSQGFEASRLSNVEYKMNFILFLAYQFLFQLMAIVTQRQCDLLKKNMYETLNVMDSENIDPIEKPVKSVIKSVPKKITNKVNKLNFAHSLSSECAESWDETMRELKNTALESIQGILDSSDDEDASDTGGQFELDFIDKLHFSDDELDGEDNNRVCFFDPDDRTDAEFFGNQPLAESKKLDQLLVYLYSGTSMPLIKFFCDYMLSNEDFMDLLQHLDALLEYFDIFYQFLNMISEFDLKILLNYRTEIDHLCRSSKRIHSGRLRHLMDQFNFFQACTAQSMEFKQEVPLSLEVEYMNLTGEMAVYFGQLLNLAGDDDYLQLSSVKKQLAVEKYSYICIRRLIVFGAKLALLQLDLGRCRLSLEQFHPRSIHNTVDSKSVRFVFQLTDGINQSADLYRSITSESRLNKQLIVFADPNDKEVESVCVAASNHSISTTASNNSTSKSISSRNSILHVKIDPEVSKKQETPRSFSGSPNSLKSLPCVLVDPYAFVEGFDKIRKIVQENRAIILLPKLVIDFLDNTKSKSQKAFQAHSWLEKELFRGSCIVRFLRNEERLELQMLNYPRYVWRRGRDNGSRNRNEIERQLDDISNVNVQDLALFYELLEHCNYQLVKKLLDKPPGMSSGISNGIKEEEEKTSDRRIILLTDNPSKWPPTASQIAHNYGVDIETWPSFLEKINLVCSGNNSGRANKWAGKNKLNQAGQHQSKKQSSVGQRTSPQSPFFKPIQPMFTIKPDLSVLDNDRRVT